jgi:hypothetical protein
LPNPLLAKLKSRALREEKAAASMKNSGVKAQEHGSNVEEINQMPVSLK